MRKVGIDEIIPASKCKSECVQVREIVRASHRSIIITKRNVPIARLIPIDETKEEFFGKLKGTVLLAGDSISPIDDAWNSCS